MTLAKFYLTTAIDYVNGEPHLGHAYEKIAADVIARYHRLAGDDTLFLTGTDEHSLNVARRAHEEGISPKELCDRMVAAFKRAWEVLDISYDRFIRTTDEDHIATVKDIVRRIYENGYIYQGTYAGWYCVSCERFLNESDLVDGRCPVHPTRNVEWVEEKNYYFALSKFQERLLQHIQAHPEFVQPETRRNEVLNRIQEGLQDVSISRSTVEWGIPLPIDEKQVVYVWFDALINYVTGAGYVEPERFGYWWPADLHIVGKDITWFHCVIWPAILMAAGLPLPKTVFGHGFINIQGARLSKSAGVVVDPVKLAEEYGSDAVRYYLMREVSFGKDGDFSIPSLRERYNADLANDLGNLLNRTLAMIERFLGGVVRRREVERIGDERDAALVRTAQAAVRAYQERMEALDLSEALAAVWTIVGDANKYIDEKMPWALAKDPARREQLELVMYNLAEALRVVAVLVSPFIPRAARGIWQQLGLEGLPGAATPDEAGLASCREWGWLPDGTQVKKGAPLFPRLEPTPAEDAGAATPAPAVSQAAGGAGAAGKTDKTEEGADLISIEEFARIELRVARVLAAEKVAGADKLLRLEIDLGGERRQIVAGIARFYTPEEMVGKEIVVVANLKPAKLRGIVSEGMLLAATSADGQSLALVTPERPVGPGAKVK
ncbi:MAG: methionine--tRNA ligase [Limnochordales bacterium]|nr:methionine--tRNA ligase [Limnochordales bacterium]